MHIGPIFRSLMHNKSRFWLVTLEVALTLAIVVNCVNLLMDMRGNILKPSGIDEDNLIVVYTQPFGESFREEEYLRQVQKEDLRQLRAMPGVRGAVAINQIPLSGSGSATSRKPLDSDMDTMTLPYFVVSDGALETLDVDLIAGRDFEPEDFAYDREAYERGEAVRPVILSQRAANDLFPEGNALGQTLQSREGDLINRIIGIVDHLVCSWPTWEFAERSVLFPGEPGDSRDLRYLVRAEPAALDEVYGQLFDVVDRVETERVIEIRTLHEVKMEFFETSLATMKMLTAVIFLIVVVTSLGIVGLTSFWVTERTRQIGTRRALGATKIDIVRYFLVENWMITGIGLVIGLGLTFALNYLLAQFADAPKVGWGLIAAGAFGLWLTGVIAALAPALRATGVSPEIATRTI